MESSSNYISTTAHFFDQNLFKRDICLGVDNFPHPHTALNIAEKIRKKLEEFEIASKISAVVTDHAANMIAGVRELKSLLKEDNKIDVCHFFCSCHSINLIVQHGWKEISDS